MSEKLHAVAQHNNRPFVQVAASIKRRAYRSRTLLRLAARARFTPHLRGRVEEKAEIVPPLRKRFRLVPIGKADIQVFAFLPGNPDFALDGIGSSPTIMKQTLDFGLGPA